MTRLTRRSAALLLPLALASGCRPEETLEQSAPAPARWWKGNLHTHSLWSDGDHYPEMVADWYRAHGYHFLSLTDHNPPPPEHWVIVPAGGEARRAYEEYRRRFGEDWTIQRTSGDTLRVRLRGLDDYRARLEEAGSFLLIPGEEITQYLGGKAAHLNGINLVEPVPPQEGATLVEILRRDLAVLAAQRQRTTTPVIGVLNHPNFLWSQTAEDLLALERLRFFELYNAHPLVNVAGDSLHASTERMWDIVLTRRAARNEPLLYGIATDDAHDYHRFGARERNPGRGWIMVRAETLSAPALVRAMERGDFYASTGVELRELARAGNRLSLRIRSEPGMAYVTQYIGTRVGSDTTSIAVRDGTGTPLTRRYAPALGAVLSESRGDTASYTFAGDELYVRARVLSSKPKTHPSYAGEREMLWTQPVRP